MRGNSIEKYFENLKSTYCSDVLKEKFGSRYQIGESGGSIVRIRLDKGLEVVRAEINKNLDLNFDNRDFRKEALEVGYCSDGEIEITIRPDGGKRYLKSGDMFIYKMRNDVEKFEFNYRNSKTVSVSMGIEMIESTMEPGSEKLAFLDWKRNLDGLFSDDVLIIKRAENKVKNIAAEIAELSADDMMGYVLLKSKSLELISASVSSIRTKKEVGDLSGVDPVELAQKMIEKNPGEVVSLLELSKSLSTSIYRLQKGFKKATGDTVYAYVQKVRIEKAKGLLKTTDMSILDIANEVGYENPSKFASVFKRYNGRTPYRYRKERKSE